MQRVKKTRSIIMAIGMLLYLAYSLTDRFITPLTDAIAIPWMAVACVLMVIGLARRRISNSRAWSGR